MGSENCDYSPTSNSISRSILPLILDPKTVLKWEQDLFRSVKISPKLFWTWQETNHQVHHLKLFPSFTYSHKTQWLKL